MRWLVRMLNAISPRLTALWLTRIWFSTRRFKLPVREKKWLTMAQRDNIDTPYGKLATYLWDQQGPTVVLIHGWSGRGLQMGAFAEPLQQAGFRVLAFDAPGHGESAGNSTTIYEILDCLRLLEQRHGLFHGAVAHSFGGMVLACALADGMSMQRVVSIGSPVQVEFLVESFCDALRVPEASRQRFRQRLLKLLGDDMYERGSTDRIAHRISTPLLLIHDRQDQDVPVSQSELLSGRWPQLERMITDGLGHRRILRDTQVVDRVVEYLKSG
jgi:pimeloyl-ACP methyl ester carboxylesterase